MLHESQRVVLRPQVTREDVQDIAWEFNWNAIEAGDRSSDTPVDVWQTLNGGTEIRFVQDRPIGMRYFLIHGTDCESVVRDLRNAVPTWTFPDALSFVRHADDRDDTLIGLYAVALSAASTDRGAAVEQLRAMAGSPDAGIRQAVVIATGYLGWPELIALVEEIHRTDPVDHVRTNAGVLLDGLRRHGTATSEGP
ncbi:HEAT repeat domain-containing protein [Streptomyces sp. NPDC059863]|uniref:HEAT repeat domain-containing protein n=1 Tax=unclassified Streptomyces TaxID=2593676 RepID=UPI00365583CC